MPIAEIDKNAHQSIVFKQHVFFQTGQHLTSQFSFAGIEQRETVKKFRLSKRGFQFKSFFKYCFRFLVFLHGDICRSNFKYYSLLSRRKLPGSLKRFKSLIVSPDEAVEHSAEQMRSGILRRFVYLILKLFYR